MKKSSVIGIIVVVLIVVVGGGFALFHKSKMPASKTSNSTVSTNAPAAAVNDAVLVTKSSSSLGQYLAEPNGQALYTFGGDTSGVSNCTGSCLASWPAYQDKGSTSGLPAGVSTIKRTDNGETQFTFNGMPLYTFVGDSNGQVTGNGVENFTIAKPAATTSSTSSSTNQPASSSQPTTTTSTTSSSTSSGSGW